MAENLVTDDVIKMFKEHLVLTDQMNQGVVIENCEPFDPKLKGHKIVLPEKNFDGVWGTLLEMYPIYKVDINSAFRKRDPKRIKTRLNVVVNSRNTTFTESLINYCGGVEEMFGLFKNDKKKKDHSSRDLDLEVGREESKSSRGRRDDRDQEDYIEDNKGRDDPRRRREDKERDDYRDRGYEGNKSVGKDDVEPRRRDNDDLINEEDFMDDREKERAYEEDRDDMNEDNSNIPPARQIKKLTAELQVYKNRVLDLSADLDEKYEECKTLRKEKEDAELLSTDASNHLKEVEERIKNYESIAIKCEVLESNEKATSLALSEERKKCEKLEEGVKLLEGKIVELEVSLKEEQGKSASIPGFVLPRTLTDDELRGVFSSLVTCDPTTLKSAFISMCTEYDGTEEYVALYKIAGDLSQHIMKVSGHSGF